MKLKSQTTELNGLCKGSATYVCLDLCLGGRVRDGDGDNHVQRKVLASKAGLDLDIDLHPRPAQLTDKRRYLHSQIKPKRQHKFCQHYLIILLACLQLT